MIGARQEPIRARRLPLSTHAPSNRVLSAASVDTGVLRDAHSITGERDTMLTSDTKRSTRLETSRLVVIRRPLKMCKIWGKFECFLPVLVRNSESAVLSGLSPARAKRSWRKTLKERPPQHNSHNNTECQPHTTQRLPSSVVCIRTARRRNFQ